MKRLEDFMKGVEAGVLILAILLVASIPVAGLLYLLGFFSGGAT